MSHHPRSRPPHRHGHSRRATPNADYLRANGFCQGECAIADGASYGYQAADDAYYNGVREICMMIQSESCTEG